MAEDMDPLTEVQARYPYCFLQARRSWDPSPRDKLIWNLEFANLVSENIREQYFSNIPFFTKTTIQNLEDQIDSMDILKEMGVLGIEPNTYRIPGIDGQYHWLTLPSGLVYDENTDLTFKYLRPIVKFAPIQSLAVPHQESWNSQWYMLPVYVSNWCIRTDLPPMPSIPVHPAELVAGYRRRTVQQACTLVERLVEAISGSENWRSIREQMLLLGLTPMQPMFTNIVMFVDSDILRSNSTWALADLTLVAFSLVLSRFVGDLPIYVSESTSDTPLPRDPLAREFFMRLGIHVVGSDARLFLLVDGTSIVMERGIGEVPVRQVLADFSMPAPPGDLFMGPPMIVRPALQDDDDFRTSRDGQPVYTGNSDSPRTRVMLKEYEITTSSIPDPYQVLEDTVVYFRKVPDIRNELSL